MLQYVNVRKHRYIKSFMSLQLDFDLDFKRKWMLAHFTSVLSTLEWDVERLMGEEPMDLGSTFPRSMISLPTSDIDNMIFYYNCIKRYEARDSSYHSFFKENWESGTLEPS